MNIIAANGANLNISASSINITKGDITTINDDIIIGSNPTTIYNGMGLINNGGQNYTFINYATSSAVVNFGAVDFNNFNYSTEVLATATPTQITFQDFSFGDYSYKTWLTLYANSGTNPKPFFNRGIQTSGSIEITGSAHGNVVPVSVASNTASIDLSKGNFFTLTLSDAITTNINITNPQPGTTALLKITNTGIPSASFSNNVKQQRYQSYIPTSGSNTIDLLSIQSFDSNTVFVTKAQNFV